MLVVSPLLTAVCMNLGNQVLALLNDRLPVDHYIAPPGVGHLEDSGWPATSPWLGSSTVA